jgi:hypothetical protein
MTTKPNFPTNTARHLIEIVQNVPLIGYLSGNLGREINEAIKKDYAGIHALQIGNYSKGIVKGSNSFYAVAVQKRLPEGVRVAAQADLEKAIKEGILDLSGTYEDTGLVLRTEGKPNSYLADNLMTQVKARLGKKAKMPVMIPLYGLELARDSSSPYGLVFKLGDEAEIITALILNKGNGNFSSRNINVETGLPKRLGNGDRIFYTRQEGLSRLYLTGGLLLDSGGNDLANSYDDGRVVLVKETIRGGVLK